MKKLLSRLFFLIALVFCQVVWADSFVVNHIEVRGLHRVSQQTVESYLPVKRGQTLNSAKTGEMLKSLYQTGFFEHINLSRSGNTLIIQVEERPTIGQLKITGNSVIPTDKLISVMKSLDIAEGRVYNPVVVERITKSLLNQYYILGRYNARVDVRTAPMSRNRVIVNIVISEGLVAKVRDISIIGCHVFKESTLIKQLDFSTTNAFSFFTQSDRYSEEKLEISLDKLRSYYMDRGYLRFEIKSAQAQVTPDRKSVYVTIVVQEGEPFNVERVDLTGHYVLPKEVLMKKIDIHPGDQFSRKKVIDAEKAITKELGDHGYLFATITVHPMINDAKHVVTIVFEVKSGKRAYIRHVTFSDNAHTNDVVLRREMQQLESAPASTSHMEDSKRRLLLLPYIKEVDMSVKPVPNVDDKVDVNYKVKEEGSAQASFRIGYSDEQHTILGAGINQKNFLGTGNTLGLNVQRSKYEQTFGIDYTNPYYTDEGISRSFIFNVSRIDPAAIKNNSNDYTTNEYDLGMLFGIPVGQEQGVFNRIYTGVIYQNTLVNPNGNPNTVSNQVRTFINNHGRRFQELDFRLGYARDSRDKAIFATRGIEQSVNLDVFAPVTNESVSFYTGTYQGKWYQPLTEEFIILTKGNLGYGNGFHGVKDYPFFRNFYAGGMDSVRGYAGNTLGPQDSLGKAYGGNILADASVGLIFPNYLSENLRTSVFVDAGNVYAIGSNKNFGCQKTPGNPVTCSTNSGSIRYSSGVEADILTPIGPIRLSLAKPLNLKKHQDTEDVFQFSISGNF